MYNLIFVTEFLKGKHPKNKRGSAHANDLRVILVSSFVEEEINDEWEWAKV